MVTDVRQIQRRIVSDTVRLGQSRSDRILSDT
jgi:hypothetical protein